jgi:hypothetical protein
MEKYGIDIMSTSRFLYYLLPPTYLPHALSQPIPLPIQSTRDLFRSVVNLYLLGPNEWVLEFPSPLRLSLSHPNLGPFQLSPVLSKGGEGMMMTRWGVRRMVMEKQAFPHHWTTTLCRAWWLSMYLGVCVFHAHSRKPSHPWTRVCNRALVLVIV